MTEEKRIYVVIPATVQVGFLTEPRTIVQPHGRQIAQACHVVSKLRWNNPPNPLKHEFEPITTIVLQARDSKELAHVLGLAMDRCLEWAVFNDENLLAYGPYFPITALAVLANPADIADVLDYLPLWGS